MPRIHNSKHISPFSTFGSYSTCDRCISPLMSLNPLAPAFLPQFQSSCDSAISLGNSTTRSFPLAQLFCGMPPQIIQPHAPSINQHITNGTFLLPSLQLTSQSMPNAQLINQLLNFQFFCLHLYYIRLIASRLFIRLSNSLTNN